MNAEKTEALETKLRLALDTARALSADIARGPGGREIALVITNIQQALHWLRDAREG